MMLSYRVATVVNIKTMVMKSAKTHIRTISFLLTVIMAVTNTVILILLSVFKFEVDRGLFALFFTAGSMLSIRNFYRYANSNPEKIKYDFFENNLFLQIFRLLSFFIGSILIIYAVVY